MNASPLPLVAAPPRAPFADWLSGTNDITGVFLSASRVPGLINLAGGLPEPETFPVAEVAELARQAILTYPQDTLGYGPVAGLPELRDCLAARFSTSGLTLTRDNILITTSGMQGLELIGKVLLEPGSRVAAQFPTYLGALDAWRPRNPTYRNIVLEDPGFDPIKALTGAQFAYAVPNFSNPTGLLVDTDTRRGLVAAAHRTGTWLIEDDPYGALLYDGAPLPHMIELAAEFEPGQPYAGPVVYMGTLSKQIAPGLRVGWVIAAPEMIAALTIAKQGSDMCTSGVTQRIALRAIESGLLDALRPRIVDLYRARRDALCAALADTASDWLDWQIPVGGMFIWAKVKDETIDTDRLLPACLTQGLCISPSSVFDALGQNKRFIRLNFTLNPPEKLALGVERLVAALKSIRPEQV